MLITLHFEEGDGLVQVFVMETLLTIGKAPVVNGPSIIGLEPDGLGIVSDRPVVLAIMPRL